MARKKTEKEIVVSEPGKLEVKIFPVPSNHQFTILPQTADKKTYLSMRIFNQTGVQIEMKKNLQPGQYINVGANWLPGVYFAEFVQGTQIVSQKLVKH